MPKRIHLRALTEEEKVAIERLAASRKEPMRLVQRARVIAAMAEDATLTAAAAGLRAGFSSPTVGQTWAKRFNEQGLAGLADEPRAGRPPTHSQGTHSALIDLAVQKPSTLGYPFALWTLERLQCAFEERHHTHLSDSTIWTWLAEEGFEWKRQQSWFHEAEKHDPDFSEKRGPSFRPT
jgi:transposase